MAEETSARVSSTDYRKHLDASAAYQARAKGVDVVMRGDEITAPALYGRDAQRLGRVIIDVLTGNGYELVREPQFHPLNIAVRRRIS